VDVRTPAIYTLTYTATDGTNASTPVIRTVTVVPVADVSVTAVANLNPVPTGSSLTYTMTVQNAGPQPAQGVLLTDPLPAGINFVNAIHTVGTVSIPKGNTSLVTWSVGTLAQGQKATLTVTVKVNARAGTAITNTATVRSSSPRDPTPDNNSASVMTTVTAKH
jgi:uncharacterized repeat protein (TIGR01451 family)